jgi:signal transduction histidine kinase
LIGGTQGERRRRGLRLRPRLRSALSTKRLNALTLAVAFAVAVVAWSSVTLYTEQLRFAVFAPKIQVGVETATVIARLFGALVLSMFITEKSGERLQWVAGGLLVSGLGGLVFEYLDVTLGSVHNPNTATYESLVVWTVAAVLFAVGLVPRRPPRLGRRLMLMILAVFGGIGFALHETAHLLPPLILEASSVATAGGLPYEATKWNWVLAVIPLGLASAATLGAASLYRRGALEGWLLVAMVLLACSQMRTVVQPLAYSPVLTSADLFRFAFAAVVALGGILKLHHIASEREALLATEKETNRHLEELAVMKADFTAMIAHELNSPLAAIRWLADMLSTDNLTAEERKDALEKIQSETDALNALVEDVRTAGIVERDDFDVELRPVPLKMLLDAAAAFFRTLPGDHPLVIEVGTELAQGREERVWADAGRIGQVLRNLLSNAAKYSPEGAPVEIRVMLETGDRAERVRIEVADSGRGIHPDDVARIFEKFGRGRDASGRKVPGVGLGLYLSRRITRCHDGELTVRSTSGAGSVFAFELEAVR